MSYDPLQPDAYAEHLGEVDKFNHVTLAEDVRNAKGILIAKKGERVSREVVDKIIQFKLLKPIEESVEISDSLTSDKVSADIRTSIRWLSDSPLHERYELDAEVRRGVKLLNRFPILRQKLTVLSLRMPQEYRKALLVACFSAIIANKLDLSDVERDHLMLAALAHDIGMLHIDHKVAEKTAPLTPEDWRTLQGHVAISYAIFKETDGMLPQISRAVLEHHEVSDGTGYLTGKQGVELSVMGRIVGVVDAMSAVLVKLEAQGRSPRDLIPILRVNGYVYDRDVCGAFIQLLTEHRWPETGVIGDANMPAFAEAVLRDREALSSYADRSQELLAAIPPEAAERMSVKAARVVHQHLTSIVYSSGILDVGYVAWLRSVVRDRQREYYREVEDTRLMLDEVRWQLVKLTRLLWAVEQDKNALTSEQHHRFLNLLNDLPALTSAT